MYLQKDCFEVYALVPGLLREEVSTLNQLYVSYLTDVFSYFTFGRYPSVIYNHQTVIIPIVRSN